MGETLKISNRLMARLHTGINSLDGIRVGKDEQVPFEFDPQVRWNLAKNGVIIDRSKDEFDLACRKLMAVAKIIPGDEVNDSNRDRMVKLKEETDAANDSPVEIHGLLFVKLSELYNKRKLPDGKKEAINLIPTSTLKNLAPIIVDDMSPA